LEYTAVRFGCGVQLNNNNNMEIQDLEFSVNWNNKLHCESFTSIRLSNPKKYNVGAEYRVVLFGNAGHTVKIFPKLVTCIGKAKVKMSDFTEYMCWLDTGKSMEDTKALIRDLYRFKTVDVDKATFDYCLFKYSDKQSEIQGSIFG